MKKTVPVSYMSMLCIGIVLIFINMFVTKVKWEPYELQQIEPTSYVQVSDKELEVTFDANTFASKGDDIAFATIHQFVTVTADGENIYELKEGNKHFGNTPGCAWNFISIPDSAKEVKITFVAAYKNVEYPDITFYQGENIRIFHELIRGCGMAVFASIWNINIGILLIVYWAIMRRKMDIGNSVLYLGLFGLDVGLWSLGETNAAELMFANRPLASFCAFIFLMQLSIPFVLFVKEFIKSDDKIGWKLVCAFSGIDFVICNVLQLLQIKDFKETAYLTHTALVLALVYLFFTIVHQIRIGKISREVVISIIGLAIMIVSTAIDMICYYANAQDIDFVGRFGFMVFVLLLGSEAASNTFNMIDKGRKAQIYEELAMVDSLTGMLNRNAYITDVKNLKDVSDVMVVTFDLNNLKHCNDTLGHMYGDKYIVDAAAIIAGVYAKYGKCYRIGGDEFCTLITNANSYSKEELGRKLEQEEDAYNSQSKDVRMEIAYGYADFDKRNDADLEATRCRADARMYEYKRESKEQA